MCAGKTGDVTDEKFCLRATLHNRCESFHNEMNLADELKLCEPIFAVRRDVGECAAAGAGCFGFMGFNIKFISNFHRAVGCHNSNGDELNPICQSSRHDLLTQHDHLQIVSWLFGCAKRKINIHWRDA